MELISCPSCGQKQSDQNETCISCGSALHCAVPPPEQVDGNLGQDGDSIRQCPYCGVVQGSACTVCIKCGKSMRRPLKIQKWVFVSIAIDLFLIWCMVFLIMNEEPMGWIGLYPVGLVAFAAYWGLRGDLERAGTFIDQEEMERMHRISLPAFPLLSVTGLPGVKPGTFVWIYLDVPRQQFMFWTEDWERTLFFGQVIDIRTRVETATTKRSPATTTAIGAALGGTTGAVIGLAVGMEDDVSYHSYLEILYHPKEAPSEISSISASLDKGLSFLTVKSFVQQSRVALGLDKPDSPPTPIQKRGSL